MTIKDRLKAVGQFVLARLSEPSTIKGLIMAGAAFGWLKLDTGGSKGEAMAAVGLMIVGMINAGLSQTQLYRTKPGPE